MTAWLEAQQGVSATQPLTICTYDVQCADILDLTDSSVRHQLGADLGSLSSAWEEIADEGRTPPSWALADRLIGQGVAGILVPSFVPEATADDVNLVFWDWSDTKPHQVRVVDDEGRLPRDDSSWRGRR